MNLISKSVYIDKLDDIVDTFKKTYHRTIKMNTTDVKPIVYINFDVEKDDKFQNVKSLTILEYQNIWKRLHPKLVG